MTKKAIRIQKEKEYQARYYLKNKEKLVARKKLWYQANKEAISKRKKEQRRLRREAKAAEKAKQETNKK